MSEFDLVIRGGTVYDGTGGEPYRADVGIRDGVIAAVGERLAGGREEIAADGLMVTPGFVDIHTHYDGQVTWENRLVPSSSHGVTTAVMGNCGVGFAPCRPDQRENLIRLMEGVEDIPYPVLVQGLPWTWETFTDYLDLLASRRYDMDIACYLPHAALRVYVMGQRGADREPATPADIAQMADLFAQALDAGAMGIATSRTIFHRSSDGKSIPTLTAGDDELMAFADVMRAKDKGVFQIVEDVHESATGLAHMRAIAERAGRPLTFSIGTGNSGPQRWPQLLEQLREANMAGVTMKAQLLPRAIGMMLGHELTLNPFYSTPAYLALASLPLEGRLAELRKPDVRARILADAPDPDPALVLGRMVRDFGHMFLLGNPPNYEQSLEQSVAARAQRAGVSPEELAYDLMLEDGGHNRLYLAMANYLDGKLDAQAVMLRHPDVLPGLGDGGAHCGTICDGSYSTFLLMHWGRDRPEGRLPLPEIVHRLSRATALTMGLDDRGLVAPGYKADLNVIDFAGLRLHPPEVAHDLPAQGRRLVQRAEGYVATLVSGHAVYREGEHSGALPGRLVRGAQVAPAAA